MVNPFATLGVPATMELDTETLESRYLALSREHHPDFQASDSPTAMVEVLQRSAAINDAHRLLRDPWTRAEALIEHFAPGAMQDSKTLCPMFLLEAMEIRERVVEDAPDTLPELQATISATLERLLGEITEALASADEAGAATAATLLHQSTYYRKALADLRQRTESTP